jgi:hypothetical protein
MLFGEEVLRELIKTMAQIESTSQFVYDPQLKLFFC